MSDTQRILASPPLSSGGLQMGFVISLSSLMDDRSLPVIRIKYKEGHKVESGDRRPQIFLPQ